MPEEKKLGRLPEQSKPPYDSPITYVIQNPQQLYKDVLEKGSVFAGPKSNLTGEPIINLRNGSFSIILPERETLREIFRTPLNKSQIDGINKALKIYLGQDISLIPKVDPLTHSEYFSFQLKDRHEELANIGHENSFFSSFPSVNNVTQFEDSLKRALDLFRIFYTEAYRALGSEPPQGEILIGSEDSMKREQENKILGDLLEEENFSNRHLLNYFKIRLPRYNKFEENIFSKWEKTLPESPPAFPHEETPPEVSKMIERVKKKMGVTRDSELEGLRQSIVIEDKPDVSFGDIAGQDEAVNEARQLSQFLSHPELSEAYGIETPRGILFYGPPGTGKTMIAKALANEANAGFVYVKATDLASKWYGDAEKLAKGIFTIAREEAEITGHCILYIDEVDAILPPRNSGDVHEVTHRVVSIFLQEMDGLATQSGKITVVASTNILDHVDPAFLSRMTAWIEVPLPEASGRRKIFETHFRKSAEKANKNTLMDSSVDLDKIAQACEGLSGRDIADLVQEVLMKKAIKSLRKGFEPVTQDDILEAIKKSSKARTAKKEIGNKNRTMGFRPN